MRTILLTGWISIMCFWGIVHAVFWAAWPLDFYTQIDDAGESIAEQLTSTHLKEYETFHQFGKHCRNTMPWLDTVDFDESLLQEVSRGVYTKLLKIASEKDIQLHTVEFQKLTDCLARTYASVQKQAQIQQTVLERSSQMSIYQDGDRQNSDFDIMDDIRRINRLIFAEEIPYKWKAHPTQKSLDAYFRWEWAPWLILPSPWNNHSGSTWPGGSHSGGENAGGGGGSNTGNLWWGTSPGNTHPLPPPNTLNPPWNDMCTIPENTPPHDAHNMVDPRFLDELERIRRGNHRPGGGYDYGNQAGNTTAPWNSEGGWGGTSTWGNDGWVSVTTPTLPADMQNTDFFDTPPCEGIACVTISTRNSKARTSRRNVSIEAMLEKHIDTMLPVSWSDLWGQRMTQNSYQIPFSGVIQFAKKIAGGRVFIHDTPQIGRHFQSEQTETREETYFDNAYRCALIDAGLPLEELKSAGVIGAGFILREHELRNVDRAGTPLNSTNIASLRNENYCHEIHAQSTRDRFGENLSTELGEIQAFTTAINDVIAQILDSELKLDRLKVQ